MAQLKPAIEHSWSSKNYVFLAYLVTLLYVLHAREPHQVHHVCAIAEMSHKALLPRTHLKYLIRQYPAPYLHKGHLQGQLPDFIYLSPVNMLVGVVLQQVAKGVDAQLLVEYLLPLRTHSVKVLYVLVKYAAHFSLAKIVKKTHNAKLFPRKLTLSLLAYRHSLTQAVSQAPVSLSTP